MTQAVAAPPYPQQPPLTQEELVEFLGAMPVAALASHNPDGTIHVAPVWFQYVDGDILLGTQAISRKVRNIELDPDVTVMIDSREPPYRGVMIYGTATLDTDDLVAKRIEIFARFMPRPDADGLANGLAARYQPAVIRVHPTRFASWDYSKPSIFG